MPSSLERQYIGPVVTLDMRDTYFKAFGHYASDEEVHSWWHKPIEPTPNLDGGKNSFYSITGCTDVDDLAEHWNLRFDEFNCLKAIAGIALGSRHNGTSPLRDAKKLQHYANRIVARLQKENK